MSSLKPTTRKLLSTFKRIDKKPLFKKDSLERWGSKTRDARAGQLKEMRKYAGSKKARSIVKSQ